MFNCIQCSVVEAFVPELEGEWCNSSCKRSLWCVEKQVGPVDGSKLRCIEDIGEADKACWAPLALAQTNEHQPLQTRPYSYLRAAQRPVTLMGKPFSVVSYGTWRCVQVPGVIVVMSSDGEDD